MAGKQAYPPAPKDFTPDQRRAWNSLIDTLEARERFYVQGPIGTAYKVSGATTVSITVDLASINVTATTQMLVKLIKDLKNAGALNATFIT